MQLKKRSEIPVEETWNLQDLFSTEADYVKALAELQKDMAIFTADKTPLKDPAYIINRINTYEKLRTRQSLIRVYNRLNLTSDMTDPVNKARNSRYTMAMGEIAPQFSAFDTKLRNLPVKLLREVARQDPSLKTLVKNLLREKKHKLGNEAENAIARLSPVINLPNDIYLQAKLADLTFPSFTVNGKEYPLSFVLFENHYQYEPDLEIRRAAYKAFSKTLRSLHNTIGTAYIAQVRQEKAMATLRKFESVFDYLLDDQEVPREVYEQHLDTIMEYFPRVMRKYMGLLKKVHQIEHLHYADLKLNLDPSYVPTVTIPEAKEYVREALSVMGTEYMETINAVLDQRGVDWAQNIGKSTGAFCSGPHKAKHPYVLLSFTGLLSNVFSLAHELGHAGDVGLGDKGNNIFNLYVSTYLSEAPSTMNEVLLAHSLIKKNQDPRYQRFVLSSLVGNTYYHNYVTHFIEAYYQREVYRAMDRGEALTPDRLDQIMKDTLQKFWGPEIEIDDDAGLTWMRQPHYYEGLYSYTYSAGLSIGTRMARRIQKEGQSAVDQWAKVLKAGGTLNPVEFGKMAGVDIRKKDMLIDTMDYVDSMVDQCIALTEKIK